MRFKIENNVVALFVNDIPAGQFPIDPAKCAGSGVILEPTSIWGNGVFTTSLSDFAAQSVLGRTWLPEVNNDVKNQVLTVPRFEKDDPPRHLLLAANGDVLRGEISAATDTHFGFRCGMENINVPRDRVRAVIWLQPPAKGRSRRQHRYRPGAGRPDLGRSAQRPTAHARQLPANRPQRPSSISFARRTTA